MSHQQHDEIDLVYVIGKLKQTIKNWISLAFKAIDFVINYKYVLLTLVVLGIGLGYFQEINTPNSKYSDLIVRLNFNSTDYVYNTVDQINSKINDFDQQFFSEKGITKNINQIKEITIEPVQNLNDLIEEYEPNNRNIEMILNTFELNDENPADFYLKSAFSYHKLRVKLSEGAGRDVMENLLVYLNSDTQLNKEKEQRISVIKSTIGHNVKSLEQIDDIIAVYISKEQKEELVLEKNQVYVEGGPLNVPGLITSKKEILEMNEMLNQELARIDNIAVPVGDVTIVYQQKGLLAKKSIIYPLLLVFVFLFSAYLVYLYKSLRAIAKNNNRE